MYGISSARLQQQPAHYSRNIIFQLADLQLNESACTPPLVETNHSSSWYEGIIGCGIQCENPIFDKEEHTRIHRFVGAFGSLSFICSLFTMVSVSIAELNNQNYPCITEVAMSAWCKVNLIFILFQITFLIGWKSQNRYPSVILFYMNSCFGAASVGFLIQFVDGARNRTVCRQDNTMRLQEPGWSTMTAIVFIIVTITTANTNTATITWDSL